MKTNSFVILFWIDAAKGDKSGRLRMQIRWNSNKQVLKFDLGYIVDKEKWSRETQRCKLNTSHGKKKIPSSIINANISEYEAISKRVFTSFKSLPSSIELKAAVNRALGKTVETSIPAVPLEEKKLTLVDYFDEFVVDVGRRNSWTSDTQRKYSVVRKRLISFDVLDMESWDDNCIYKYIHSLRHELNMKDSTITKQLRYLKCFFRWLQVKGLPINRAFETASPVLRSNSNLVVFLDWDELMIILNFQLSHQKDYLAKVRDVFCFCCFTGLRYSDVANLKKSNVFESFIAITTIKTGDAIKLELNKYAKAILDKYKDYYFEKNIALPVVTNSRMNASLKELCELCGFTKEISRVYYRGKQRCEENKRKFELIGTHTARRTFICNALQMGIQPHVVMKLTGHKSYKSMQPYIDVTDRSKIEAMRLFDKR